MTDYMKTVPDQIARFIPPLETKGKRASSRPRPFLTLGTDGFGRSDTRAALRRFFEVDEAHVVIAVLAGLFEAGQLEAVAVDKAIKEYGLDTESDDPRTR